MKQQNKMLELVNSIKLSGPDMTTALKAIGNGDMLSGIKGVSDFFYKEGKRDGIVIGSIGTTVITSTLFIAITLKKKYDNFRKEKLLKKQIDYIIKSQNSKTCACSSTEEVITSKC